MATDLTAVQQFLYAEAMLLDQRRWAEWVALFTDDGIYWVPSVPDQADPVNTVSLFYESKMLMEMRVLRLTHPRAFSQEFPTRTSHVVGNVMIEAEDAEAGTLVVRSSMHVLEFRKDTQRMFGGFAVYDLRRDGESWKIARKKVDLINCDAPLETIQVFL